MKKTILYAMVFSFALLGFVTVQAEDDILDSDPVIVDGAAPVLAPEPIVESSSEPMLTSVSEPSVEGSPEPMLISAPTGEPEVVPVVEEEKPFVIEEEIIEEGEGIKKPSGLGMWWTSVRENFVMTFTFNPEKKVERALAFAEKRMEMAEVLALNAETEEEQEKITQVMEKAESFLVKAEEKKLEVEEKILQRMEEQRVRVEQQKQKIEEYNETKNALIEKIKAGDENAKVELINLNAGKTREVKEMREENTERENVRRAQQDENIGDTKAALERRVMEGDIKAERMLKEMEREEERIMQQRADVDMKKAEVEQQRVESQVQAQEKRAEMIVGGDKDEHGCIGSAGYLWCESKEKCLRPFEDEWDDTCGFKEELEQNQNQERAQLQSVSPTQPMDQMIQKEVEKAKGLLKGNE